MRSNGKSEKLRENRGDKKKEKDKEEVKLDSKKKRIKWAGELSKIVIEKIITSEGYKDTEDNDEDNSINRDNPALKKLKIKKGTSKK